jgi:hypothetical protein
MYTIRHGLGLLVAALVAGCGAGPGADNPRSCATDLDCPGDALCVERVCRDARGARHDLGRGKQARLVVNAAAGTFDLYAPDRKLLLYRAYGYAALDGFKTELKTTALGTPAVTSGSGKDRLGSFQSLRLSYQTSGAPAATLLWRARLYDSGAYVFSVGLKNDGAARLVVDKLAPVRLRDSAGGGLFLGQHPRTHRILENGSGALMDQYASLEMGNRLADMITRIAPGRLEGYSASNWSHLIYDLESRRVWIAGALAADRGVPVMNVTAGTSRGAPDDGRAGFGFYSLESLYLPAGKPVTKGAELYSEPIYVHPTQTDPHQALEDLAQAMHDQQGLVTWTDRGLRIPNGWNSWSGSGGTGGYGTAISQDLMSKNLAVMRDYLRDWGMDYFQMDDGWQLDYGDWQIDSKRFPDGFSPGKGIVKQILDARLKPGLWIAAFSAYESSQLYKTHKGLGWFMPQTVYGQLAFSSYQMLDLTRADVLAWLDALLTRFRSQWGFVWLKLDFSYPALLCEKYNDPSLTNVEMYEKGLQVLRKALGKDSFFLNVGGMGAGAADGKRVTLDNAPVWDWDPAAGDLALTRQGFKPTIATAARRYWYQGRVFVVHPDLIIFRSDTRNTKLPRITFNEARAFAAFVAATGGIVKLGDRMVEDLAPYPERINVIRKLLPIHPQPARPLDLLTREFPERYFKQIKKPLAGYNETWGWFLALNLGLNWDYSKSPALKIPDDRSQRSVTIQPTALGLAPGTYHLFEFWTQSYLGQTGDRLTIKVPPHDSRVIAIRKKKDHPQLLGHNRHITMGAAVTKSETWNRDTRTLTLTMDVVRASAQARFPYQISFHGNGRKHRKVQFLTIQPEGLSTSETADVLQVKFTPEKSGELKLALEYE